MKALSVVLIRTKRQTNLQKFEAVQRWGPIDFLYVSPGADRKLGQPAALKVTLEPVPSLDPAVLDTIPTQHTPAANEGDHYVPGTNRSKA